MRPFILLAQELGYQMLERTVFSGFDRGFGERILVYTAHLVFETQATAGRSGVLYFRRGAF